MKKIKITWQLLFLLSGILLLPALLINLGVMTFIDDEGIRSLVALEMMLSGNYLVPTLHGELYFNKPPLFNWILVLFFKTFGRVDEFVARLPTIFSLLGYAATIYYFCQKYYSHRLALISAFLFITCGRILFWDSFLGLIDITFSWVMFTLFMLAYQFFKQEKWWSLFLITYVLTGIGFLLKGLPALVFQATTLLTLFIYKKQFRKLLGIQHFSGIGLLLLILLSYYVPYSYFTDLETVFQTLFTESSKRTPVNYSLGQTLLHFISFPFEMIYHFLPWSLMVIFVIRFDIFKKLIAEDEFSLYCLLIFITNILVYWASPEVYPRYLLMLAPLVFIPYVQLYRLHQQEKTIYYKIFDRLLFVTILLIALGSFAPLFLERTSSVNNLYLKAISIGISLLFLVTLYHWHSLLRLPILILFLITFRLGFNWFVVPDRNAEDYGNECRQTSIKIGQAFIDKPLFVYGETVMQPTNSFYLTNERQEIITRTMNAQSDSARYIIYSPLYPNLPVNKEAEFSVRHGKLKFDIITFKNK